MAIKDVDVTVLKGWIDSDEAIVIDVREPAEHKSEHIVGAKLCPGGEVCVADVTVSGKKVVLHCRKGGRSSRACEKLLQEHPDLVLYNLEGGIEAWQAAGFAVGSAGRKIFPLDRQVHIIIGALTFTFSLLALFVHPVYAWGTAFFGAGLLNAGITGWCGLGKLLAKMPWNN